MLPVLPVAQRLEGLDARIGSISEAEALKLWNIVEIGLGGYVIGRSAEKTLPRIVEVLKR